MRIESRRLFLFWTAATALAVVVHIALFVHVQSQGASLVSFAVVCLLVSFRLAHVDEAAPPAKDGMYRPRAASARSSSVFKSGLSAPANSRLVRNAFTIDLEDYFQTEVASRSIAFAEWGAMPSRVETSTHRLLDLLDEKQVSATVFVLGWVAKRHPHLVREVARRGHEIGCHSYRHRLVYSLTVEEFRKDTLAAKYLLEDVTGTCVNGYRAPSFSITPGTEWAFDALADMGFLYDSSVNPVWHPLYAHATAPRHPYRHAGSGLVEFPIASCAIAGFRFPIGGGAYLRLLPYWYCRAGLSIVNRLERKPATLYVHPWEIDSYQPFIPQEWKSRIRQTGGTSGMETKLFALLRSGNFGPIREVYAAELDHLQPGVTAEQQFSNLNSQQVELAGVR